MNFIVLQPFRSIKISSGTDYKFWLLVVVMIIISRTLAQYSGGRG